VRLRSRPSVSPTRWRQRHRLPRHTDVSKEARWAWLIHIGPRVSIDALAHHLAALVLGCERYGAREPGLVPYGHRQQEAFRWLAGAEVSMSGVPRTNRPGAIDVLLSQADVQHQVVCTPATNRRWGAAGTHREPVLVSVLKT
jgi:hypothetical protein